MKKDETLIIPLRIELRYDLKEQPVSFIVNSRDAEALHNQIIKIPADVLGFSVPVDQDSTRTVFQKLKQELRKPETSAVTQTYIFGPAYNLNDITLKGQRIGVRPAPASALAYVGNTKVEAGSCPFLFVEDEVNSYAKIGRTLVGAYDKILGRVEEIPIPNGTRSVHVSEQEFEVTYLNKILVKVNEEKKTLAENVIIRPGSSREFPIPENFRENARIIIDGYYEPLRLLWNKQN
jgi:hypothetical protein